MSKITVQDWKKIQTPIAVLALVLVIMIALIGFANYYSNKQEQSLLAQQSQLNSARPRFQSSGMDKDTIIRYLPQYQALISKGFIGEERRIEWVDELRAQHQLHKTTLRTAPKTRNGSPRSTKRRGMAVSSAPKARNMIARGKR